MPVTYRYAWNGLFIKNVERGIPPGVTVAQTGPSSLPFIDLLVSATDATTKNDLDAVMSSLGWLYSATNPSAPTCCNVVMLSNGVWTAATPAFQRIGGADIDLSLYPASMNGFLRQISFVADVQKTPGATSVEVKMVDVTNNVDITGSDLVYSASNATTRVASGPLTAGAASGNLRTDMNAQYEVQLRMNGGTGVDAVMCTNARLEIPYA